jgi:PRTRC genetic system protein B
VTTLVGKKLKKATVTPKPPVWRRRRPRPFQRELVALDRAPLAQIDVYKECVILTRRRENGAWASYPVSPAALAQTLSKLPMSTGLLPPGLISYGMYQGQSFYVQYIPARVVSLQLDDGGRYLSRAVPLPPLIWAGRGRSYRVWAVKVTAEDLTTRTPLFKAPFPNVYEAAGICWGNVGLPTVASPEAMRSVLKLFLEESRFNGHLDNGKSKSHPGSLLRLYESLETQQAATYPLDDLVAFDRGLWNVLDGSIWGGSTWQG